MVAVGNTSVYSMIRQCRMAGTRLVGDRVNSQAPVGQCDGIEF